MKITHNKVGQNLNLVDGVKSNRNENVKDAKGAKADQLSNAQADSSARIDVSARAQEAKKIKEIAMAAPDVDMAKIEKFRKMIDEGKYTVDAKAVADRMVDAELENL